MPLISFQRMRDEVDNLESQVVTKFPRLGRTGCLAIFATVVFVILVLGLAIGYGIHSDRKSRPGGGSSISQVRNLDCASSFFFHFSKRKSQEK